MKINPSLSVGEIAVELKEAIPLFEKYHIDYSCEGERNLRDSCAAVGAPLEEIVRFLEKIPLPSQEWYARERDWNQEPMAELIDHFVKTHHHYTRSQMERVTNLLEKLESSKGDMPPEVFAIRELF